MYSRRSRRKVLNILTAVSLAGTSTLTIVVYYFSFASHYSINYRQKNHDYHWDFEGGWGYVGRDWQSDETQMWQRLGWEFFKQPYTGGPGDVCNWKAVLPGLKFHIYNENAALYWSFYVGFRLSELAVLLAIWPAARVGLYLRRRPPAGGCRACGYDLTGNVSGTCPECGAAVQKRSTTA